MTRLESDMQALLSARRAQAAATEHLERERARAAYVAAERAVEARQAKERAETQQEYLEALSGYLDALQALHPPVEWLAPGCVCTRHRDMAAAEVRYKVAWQRVRGMG